MVKHVLAIIAVLVSLTLTAGIPHASNAGPKQVKSAIVVAHFGTTVPEALTAITNINEEIRRAYPNTEVRTTFTSNIIRGIWKKRQQEAQKWLDQGIPSEILYVKNVIATIGDLLEDGYTDIVVQPSHMFYMEQSYDLQQYVNALASITTMKERWKPFTHLVMGRPALGMPGDRHPYMEDIEAVVATLADDAKQAKEAGALLVYMGHGNENWSTGIYAETEKTMREVYPEVQTFIGVVEGVPSLDELLPRMLAQANRKVILKPFMIVSGDHSVNDMASDETDSWKSVLAREGFAVTPVLEGLGTNSGFARIFVDHIADASKEAGIALQ